MKTYDLYERAEREYEATKHFILQGRTIYRLPFKTSSGRERKKKPINTEPNKKDGSTRVFFGKDCVLLHRLMWMLHYGKIPAGRIVYHIDGNKTNNAIENLALADTHAEAMVAYHARKRRDAGLDEHKRLEKKYQISKRTVYKDYGGIRNRTTTYVAYTTYLQETIRIGRFDAELQAINAIAAAEDERSRCSNVYQYKHFLKSNFEGALQYYKEHDNQVYRQSMLR